jgi:hypothetical protein
MDARIKSGHDGCVVLRRVKRIIFAKGGRQPCQKAARRANHHTAARVNSARVPDAVQRPSRCCAEPGPTSTVAGWTRLSSAPLRAALRPGNAVAPLEVCQTCLMKECGESKFHSCPGRGAASFTLLRRAGTHSDSSRVDPGSAAHRCALRCVRGTLWPRRRFVRRV